MNDAREAEGGAEPARPTPPPERPRQPSDDNPVLPDRTRDEHDVGWGDDPDSGRRDDDWYRRERPPHHD